MEENYWRKLTKELQSRLSRQEVLTELTLLALKGANVPTLLRETAFRTRAVLSVEYCEVLELMSDGGGFLLRSGAGWRDGYVGQAIVGINLDSQAGYTLILDEPVIVEDVRQETRFGDTLLLEEHGVRSGITTTIYKQGHIYGVLGAHTAQPRMFNDAETSFLSSVADILGAAMDRSLSEEDVRIEAIERTEQAEAAERRFRFLAEANAMLSTSSDYAGALSCTARLAVPPLADWCFVDVIGGEDGDETNIHRLVVGYAEGTEEAETLARELELHYPLKPDASHGTPKVLRTGQPEIIREVTNEVLEAIARDAEHLAMLQKLGPHSYMCVPLRVRRRLIGALGLVTTECGRHYGEEELSMAEGLAYCSALTIDHMLRHLSQTNTVQELVQLFGESQPTAVSASQERALKLTPRQLEVLELISLGRSATEIKVELGIAEATVRGHIRSVLRAFEAHSQLEAVSRARRLGLLSS